MPIQSIGLFDLLTPQYIAGFQFPDYIHQYLSILSIREMQTYHNDLSVLYAGKASFGNAETGTLVEHSEPGGTSLSWDGANIYFRLNIPRDGAAFIGDAVGAGGSGKLPAVKTLFDDLKPIEETTGSTSVATEYPAVQFKLELLIDALNFSLGSDWIAGRVDTITHRVVPDTDPLLAGKRVTISLPKVKLVYQQGDDAINFSPKFSIDSWGMDGMDADADLSMGELVSMNPPIALHNSRHVAFSINKVIVDASKDATPPELKDHFGIDDDWTGIYIQELLFYFSNDQGIGFNFRLNEALISFAGEVSLEAALDIYPKIALTTLSVNSRFYNGATEVTTIRHGVIDGTETIPSTDPPGDVTVNQNGVVQLDISGGTPPYTIHVFQNGSDIWDPVLRRATFLTVGDQNVFIVVKDNGATPKIYSEYLKVHVRANLPAPASGSPADNPPSTAPVQQLPTPVIVGNDATHTLTVTSNNPGSTVSFAVSGGDVFTLTVTDTADSSVKLTTQQRNTTLDVPNGSSYAVSLVYAAIAASSFPDQVVHFTIDKPSDNEIPYYVDMTCSDSVYIPDITSLLAGGLPDASNVTTITLNGYASHDNASQDYDTALSARRDSVLQQILTPRFPSATFAPPVAHGHQADDGTELPTENTNTAVNTNRKVIVHFANTPVPAHTITTTLVRPPAPANPATGNPTTNPTTIPPDAPHPPNDLPTVLTQLGIRVKIEMNQLSLLELYGEIDFETELEKNTRLGIADPSLPTTNHLNLHRADYDPATDPNGTTDGLLDFKLGYMYDRALGETTLSLQFFAGEGDSDGLLHMDNNADRDDRLKNIFGAVLLFAPIINSAATSAGHNSSDAGSWAALGASIAVPVAIGALNVFRTRRIVLFGVDIIAKYTVPSATKPNYSVETGVVFDYEVQFDIICEELGIGKDRLPGSPDTKLPPPLRARYKAIGFNIDYQLVDGNSQWAYLPVFDTSKGYDLDLSDPSLFSLPDPLGRLFNIAGARLARFNPVTLEIDFALKVDLGVITVDKFKLKIPLDPAPLGPAQIIPSGVKVNIPGVLVGNGFVEIKDADVQQQDGTTIHSKGIEGGLDLTLVALKIRISADVGIMSIKDNATQREGMAVFLGLKATFPTPIILGQTGLGIFGFSGLFAMHYMRLEDPPVPTDSVGPALKWLIKAEGEPQHLRNSAHAELWGPSFDHWAFGIGIIMGTVDGVLMNFQGMFVLELPGPRILIMIKIRIVEPLPELSDTSSLEVGIIGVIDIDFNKMQLTIGVLVSFNIQDFLQISLPIEIFFKLDDSSNWHLYIGTISNPASANILNIVKGSAYLMIQGNNLKYSDYGGSVPQFLQDKTLNGVAIAVGIHASLLLGDEGAGLYLKIAAGADLGISFTPFLAVGTMHVSGELRLIIVSIGASGDFDVLISKKPGEDSFKTYLKGEICGSIDCFFFSISACIGLTIGDENFDLEPARLVRGIYLQSFSPVLVSGQGGTRPIDASLGDAKEITPGSPISPSDDLITVPIDSVIVLQFQASPKLAGTSTVPMNGSITLTPGCSPDIRMDGTESDPAGWIKLSDNVKVRYVLNSITLLENDANYAGDTPPSVWRIDKPSNSTGRDTSVDLALFSRVPSSSEHALERSTDLTQNVKIRWQNACKQPVPPASVLYTFCSQPLGVSVQGWTLRGKAQPDPAGTIRIQPVNTLMNVFQPHVNDMINTFGMWLSENGSPTDVPAQVVGIDNLAVPQNISPVKKCYSLVLPKIAKYPNPYIIQGEISIYNSIKKPIVNERLWQIRDINPLQFGELNRVNALSLTKYTQITILKDPVDIISMEFGSASPKGKISAAAYNAHNVLVARHTLDLARPMDGKFYTITLTGTGIKYVQLTTVNFVGQLLQVCITRNSQLTPAQIRQYARCFRALQLPGQNLVNNNSRSFASDKYKDQIAAYNAKRKHYNYVILNTGQCDSVIFYGAVLLKLMSAILVEELDANDNVLKTYKLSDLAPKAINNVYADLPPEWLDPANGWREQVIISSLFLFSSRFKSYEKILFELKPQSADCRKVCISMEQIHINAKAMFLTAIECLQHAEVVQQQIVQGILDTEQNTLDGYLSDDGVVPLLKPSSTYRVSASYNIEVDNTKSAPTSTPVTQEFAFRTDAAAPAKLSPYVLGSTPDMDDKFQFYQDPIVVVFNSAAVLQMYTAYGKSIQAIIRGADGVAVGKSPETVSTLQDIPASVLTPYKDAVLQLIADGLLPCLGGSIDLPAHGAYVTPFELKPLMAYTFDLQLDPADPVPDGTAVVPLYRRAFTTSRYANLKDFAGNIAAQGIKHKAITSALTSLPAASGGEAAPPVFIVTDKQIEDAVTSAGVAFSGAKDTTEITILWANQSGDFVPYAILLEASEPVWRTRTEAVAGDPVKNAQGGVIDPAFFIYENKPVDAMILAPDAATTVVSHFVRSTAGTKTVIVLKSIAWTDTPVPFVINITQTASVLYKIAESSEVLLNLNLSSKAPWEE